MRSHSNVALFVASLAFLSGCPEETVTHTRIVKAPDAPAAPAAMPSLAAPPPAAAPMGAGGGMAAMAGDVPPPPKPSGAATLTWTLPPGWTQTLAGGMRYATLKAPGEGNLDISVVVLAGSAGGELANVNRWRSQLGLTPLSEEALPAARKSLPTSAGNVSLFDFTSEGVQKSRLAAGLLQSNDNSWFFKMTGDAQAMTKAMPQFLQLLRSIHTAAATN